VSELRWHPFLEEWVVTATHRQDRTFLPPANYCPLCPTSPGGFPTEVPRDAYEFVVFDNRFPSFREHPEAPAVLERPLYPVKPATGACEVVLYTPEHNSTLAARSVRELVRLVRVWRDRYLELSARPDIEYVFIFENKGEAIGVTLHHPHGQIYAFPYIPPKIGRELDAARAHHAQTGRCLHCEVIQEECDDGRRLVAENQHFVALIPFYARYPYELHLYARDHLESLADFTPQHDLAFAQILQIVLRKYDALWERSMPYMMVIHQRPSKRTQDPGSHFHVEFYPPLRTPEKLKYLAGCESGAGTFINDTLPEAKAAELRALEVVSE